MVSEIVSQATEPPLIVCLTGSECTGKTTLACALAELYQAPLVEEAARAYLAGRTGYGCEDVLAIAREQLRLEAEALATNSPLIVCDTDLLVIRIWWEVKYGALPKWVAEQMRHLPPRLYLLTAPDFPWQPDPLRESGGDRADLHRRYQRALKNGSQPWLELAGDADTRIATARHRIDALLADRR